MRLLLIAIAVVVMLSSCTKSAVPPLPADAVATLDMYGADEVGPALSVMGLGASVADVGLGPPFRFAVRPTGGIVMSASVASAARLKIGLSQVFSGAPQKLTSHAQHFSGEGKSAVIVIDRGVVVVAVDPADPIADAALLEGLIAGSVPTEPFVPREQPEEIIGSPFTIKAPTGASGGGLLDELRASVGEVRGHIAFRDQGAHITGLALTPTLALRLALERPTVDVACVLERDAALVIHVPPMGQVEEAVKAEGVPGLDSLDAFDSRVTMALSTTKEGLALSYAGRPKSSHLAAFKNLVGAVPHAVALDDVVALTVGDRERAQTIEQGIAVQRGTTNGTTCEARPGALVVIDGPQLAQALERRRPELKVAGLLGEDPLKDLKAVKQIEIDAMILEGKFLGFTVRATLASRQ